MPIILRLDRIMADRKISLNELSDKVGISNVNMSRIKTGKIKAIRFSTLEMICKTLECQPGDILEYVPNGKGVTVSEDADPLLENTEWLAESAYIPACVGVSLRLYAKMPAQFPFSNTETTSPSALIPSI